MAGRIFEDITGYKVTEFNTSTEIWNAVVAARPTVENYGGREYGAEIVTKRGGIFAFKDYSLDIDAHIAQL